MTHREQLIAFLAVLGALVLVVLGALMIAAYFPHVIGKIEAFGFGTITGGLIGILRIPSARHVTVDNPPNNPVPVEER